MSKRLRGDPLGTAPLFTPLGCATAASYRAGVRVSVVRLYRFESAHVLPWHPGKCSRLHGHSYRLEVSVQGDVDDRGVVMDFAEVDEVVERCVVGELDHRHLNDVLENPTAERLALYAGERLTAAGLPWTVLRLWETEGGSVVVER